MDTEQVEMKRAADIAALNDAFRRGNPMRYVVTQGVQDECGAMNVLFAVRHFSDFNEDNDPYGEHDFGQITLNSRQLFWKIDYYDSGLSGWCDPLSPDCRRVLTVMLAEEY